MVCFIDNYWKWFAPLLSQILAAPLLIRCNFLVSPGVYLTYNQLQLHVQSKHHSPVMNWWQFFGILQIQIKGNWKLHDFRLLIMWSKWIVSYNNGNLRFCCAHVGMWQEEKDQATNVLKAFSCLVRKNISISTILILIRAFSCQKQYCTSVLSGAARIWLKRGANHFQ